MVRAAEFTAEINIILRIDPSLLRSQLSKSIFNRSVVLPSHIFHRFSIVNQYHRNMLGDTGLEVVPGDGLLVADHYAGRDPEDVQGQSSNSHVSPDKSSLEVNAHTPKGRGMIIFKTRYIIGLVILTLATILGGVLGGVLGSRANFRSPSGGPTATGPNITLTSPPAGAPTIYNGTNLAAVGWLGAGNLEHHRVYYQSAINEICESAWDCSSRSWYILNHNLGVAKKGTPITAVFGTRPGVRSLEI